MSDSDKQDPALPASPEEKDKEKDKDKESSSPIEPEVLDKLPPDLRKAVESFSLQAFSGPVFNPILKKITEQHIDKVLDQTEKDSARGFEDAQSTKKFNLVYAILVAALFVFATIYLTGQDKELYRDILTKLIIFFGGAGAGYGFKAFRDRD